MFPVSKRGLFPTHEMMLSELAKYAASCSCALTPARVGSQSSIACYEYMEFLAADCVTLFARVITPKTSNQSGTQFDEHLAESSAFPTILYFHDMNQGSRGWAHLTRWVALGYRVVMLEQRFWSHDIAYCDGAEFWTLLEDAVLTFELTCRLSQTDVNKIALVGEGTGAGLALDLAGIMGNRVAKLAVLNPCPASMYQAWQTNATTPIYAGIHRHFRYTDPQVIQADQLFEQLTQIDCMTYAPQVTASTLFGIGQLGQEAQVSSLEALYNLLGSTNKKLVSYPKWGYERINDFEDEVLQFIHFERKDI